MILTSKISKTTLILNDLHDMIGNNLRMSILVCQYARMWTNNSRTFLHSTEYRTLYLRVKSFYRCIQGNVLLGRYNTKTLNVRIVRWFNNNSILFYLYSYFGIKHCKREFVVLSNLVRGLLVAIYFCWSYNKIDVYNIQGNRYLLWKRHRKNKTYISLTEKKYL